MHPPFPGYNSIRLDYPSTHRGGGLLTLVKEGIVLAPVKGSNLPDSLTLNYTSVGPFTLAAGDLNAHSSLWDEHTQSTQTSFHPFTFVLLFRSFLLTFEFVHHVFSLIHLYYSSGTLISNIHTF